MAQQMRGTPPWVSGPSDWVLDGARSTFSFRVKHFWGLMTVKGQFTQVEGTATVDAAGAVTVSIRIDTTTIDTKMKQRDKHLRSADFFHVDEHPSTTFVSREIVPQGTDRPKVRGDLTAAGQTVALDFEAGVGMSGGRITVDAEAPVNRKALGMTWSPLGMAAPIAVLVVHAEFIAKS